MGNKRSRSCGDVAIILKQSARCFNIGRYPNQYLKLSSRLIQSNPEIDLEKMKICPESSS